MVNNNLVAAINEVLVEAQKSELDDSITSTSKGWSSSKIASTINSAVEQARTDILGGVPPEALNTLKELADALENNESFGSQVLNLLAGKVSFTEAQNLTDAQKAQARSNIGAISAAELGSLSDQMESAVTALDGRLTVAEGDIDSLESGLAAAQQTIVTHTTDIAELKSVVSALETQTAQQQADLTALTTTVAQNKAAAEAADLAQTQALAALDTDVTNRVNAAKQDIRDNDIGTDVDLVAIYNAAKA